MNSKRSRLLLLVVIFFINVFVGNGLPVPQRDVVTELQTALEAEKQSTDSPAMVPVSSTVIPVSSIFGNPKPEAMGTGELFPYFPTFEYSRRSRFFEKSSKPDTPVRLITKS